MDSTEISKQLRTALTGPVASLRTPFNRDGSIDDAGVRRQIDFNLNAGSKVTLITAGDSHLQCMSDKEIEHLHRVAVEHTAGRAMVIGADWEYGTPQAIEFAKQVKDIGVDVLMTRPPDWAASVSIPSLIEYYKAVAKVIPVMVVTNIFKLRPDAFGLSVLRGLLDEPNIISLKEDLQDDFPRLAALMVNSKWSVFSGGGMRNYLNMHPYGCDGLMDRHLNFAPWITHQFWAAIENNDMAAAVQVIEKYELPLEKHLAGYPGGRDAAVHGLLELAGVCGRWRRRPYHSLTDAEMQQLSQFAKEMKLF